MISGYSKYFEYESIGSTAGYLFLSALFCERAQKQRAAFFVDSVTGYLRLPPAGDTVLKVYFKKTYTVTYEPGDQGTFDKQKNPDLDYGVDTPDFVGTPEGNPGYDFTGWDIEIADKVTEDAVYVAQWDPWKYTIKYDPNGGQGEMKPQLFLYSDDEMVSMKNQFTRDGYEFVGFEYEYKGSKYFITNTKDFNDYLKALGKNSSITLVAQWKKLPDPVVKNYNLPVTGVDGHR